jgi:hypothetical protein
MRVKIMAENTIDSHVRLDIMYEAIENGNGRDGADIFML